MNAVGPRSLQELQRQQRLEAEAPRSDGQLTPLSAYIPETGDAPPLVLLSHGVGGDCSHFGYLCEALRKAGWLAIVVGHAESSLDVLRQHIAREGFRAGTRTLTMDRRAHLGRQLDIEAVLAWAENIYQPAFRALIGHSMGSGTAIIEAGARNNIGINGHDRFNAYVAISPEGRGSLFPENAWSDIRKPVLIMTGTKDQALEGDWQWRTEAFLGLPPGGNWLAVINRAHHISFSGHGFQFRVRKLVVKSVLAFLEPLRNEQRPSVIGGWGLSISTR